MHQYFKRYEFACSCGKCDCDTVDAELLIVLVHLRVKMGPIIIDSGHRCPAHNASDAVGGAPDSQHLLGKAADIKARNYTPAEVQGYLLGEYPDRYGIGIYETFTHIDVRNEKGRW